MLGQELGVEDAASCEGHRICCVSGHRPWDTPHSAWSVTSLCVECVCGSCELSESDWDNVHKASSPLKYTWKFIDNGSFHFWSQQCLDPKGNISNGRVPAPWKETSDVSWWRDISPPSPPRQNHKATPLVLPFISVLPSIFSKLESMVAWSSWGVLPIRKYSDHQLGQLWWRFMLWVGGRVICWSPPFTTFYSVRENLLYICVCTVHQPKPPTSIPSAP